VTEVPSRIGRFRILDSLGHGAMGIVYRARDESLERDVALKVMSIGLGTDPDARARFKREAQAAARLQHPNIVTIYELGEHEGSPYMVMELMEGLDLQQAILAGVRPDPKVTLPVVLQLLSGLGHAHEHGIVHRDVKPSNLFLPRGRPAKIMDFGVARLAAGGMTTAGMMVGTPNYMSPEQVRAGPVDGRSDLFSAGLILYELVTGEKAYRSDSVVALLYKIAHEDPDLSLLPQGAEWDRLRTVLGRALAQEVDERYPDAGTMSAELMVALQQFGGSVDWAAPSDLGLLSRVTPRPAAALGFTATPSPAARQESAGPATAASSPAGARAPGSNMTWALAALAAVVLAIAGWLMRPGGPAPGTPPPTPGPTSTTLAALPTPPRGESPKPSPTAPRGPTPRPSPGLTGTPSPLPSSGPASPSPAGNDASPSPEQAPENARVEHADDLLQRGRYGAALAEAKAILKKEPGNAQAKTIAEEAEAALVVEDRIKKAREAIRRGDRDEALEQVKAGLAVNANDARLMELFRELTK
jgi:serine/threonine protein kinase